MNPSDLIDVPKIEESLRLFAAGAMLAVQSAGLVRAAEKATAIAGHDTWKDGASTHTVTVSFANEADAHSFAGAVASLAKPNPATPDAWKPVPDTDWRRWPSAPAAPPPG